MPPLIVFGTGMVGAVAPEIVRLDALRSQSGGNFSLFYIMISIVFAALGGFVALILPATTLWGAFYTGISTPIVVSAALKKGMKQDDADIRNRQDGAPAHEPGPPSLAKFVSAS